MLAPMRHWILCTAVLLFACGPSPVDQAEARERQYRLLVDANAKPAELCEAAKAAAHAWLAAEDRGRYDDWRLTRDIHCRRAGQIERLGV